MGRKPGLEADEERIYHKRGSAKATNPKTSERLSPTGLGAEALDIAPERDPRQSLVDWMADPSNRFTAMLPTGYRGPAFVFGDIFVWGFTAHLVDTLLDLSGLARPWDTGVELEVPWRFLREGKGPDTPVDD